MYSLPSPFVLRQALATDQEFLDALFTSTRDDLTFAGLDPVMQQQLLKMQQGVQQAGFTTHYPDALHLVIERAGQPIGRVVVDTGVSDIRIVDIAILPFAQRAGAARAVLQALQESAREHGLGMSLAVGKANTAARALYLSHGFTVSLDDGLFEQMAWMGGAA